MCLAVFPALCSYFVAPLFISFPAAGVNFIFMRLVVTSFCCPCFFFEFFVIYMFFIIVAPVFDALLSVFLVINFPSFSAFLIYFFLVFLVILSEVCKALFSLCIIASPPFRFLFFFLPLILAFHFLHFCECFLNLLRCHDCVSFLLIFCDTFDIFLFVGIYMLHHNMPLCVLHSTHAFLVFSLPRSLVACHYLLLL